MLEASPRCEDRGQCHHPHVHPGAGRFIRHGIAVALLLLMITTTLQGQNAEGRTEGFTTNDSLTVKKIVGISAVSAVLFASVVDSYFAWWKDSLRSFSFNYDDWFNTDKVGHFFTSYFFFHSFRNLMLWSGHQPETAFWWGVGLAAFFGVTIEVGDGLSHFGFDFPDLLYDFAGVGYGMLQTQWPWLRNFKPKFGYYPSDGYRIPIRFTDHYRDHTYWLAVNLHNLLPESLRPYWPEFIQPAIGYGMDGWYRNSSGTSSEFREFVVGLDFNLGAFTVKNEELLFLQREIDMFHLPPMPAVKFTREKAPEYKLLYLR
jgi:hypothetical protein